MVQWLNACHRSLQGKQETGESPEAGGPVGLVYTALRRPGPGQGRKARIITSQRLSSSTIWPQCGLSVLDKCAVACEHPHGNIHRLKKKKEKFKHMLSIF